MSAIFAITHSSCYRIQLQLIANVVVFSAAYFSNGNFKQLFYIQYVLLQAYPLEWI